MTTWKVAERFTAAEALSFFSPSLDERAIALEPSFEHMRDPDVYWSLLSPGDRHRWRMYKVPQKSWGRKVLLALTERGICWQFLSFMRRKMHSSS